MSSGTILSCALLSAFMTLTSLPASWDEPARIVPDFSFPHREDELLGGHTVSAAAFYAGSPYPERVSAVGGSVRTCEERSCRSASEWADSALVSHGQWVQVRTDGPPRPLGRVEARLVHELHEATYVAYGRRDRGDIAPFPSSTASAEGDAESPRSRFKGWAQARIVVTGGEWRACRDGSCGRYTTGTGTVADDEEIQLRTKVAPGTEGRMVVVRVGDIRTGWYVTPQSTTSR